MGVFSRSWEITKLSFSVIKKDKEMLAFPVLSGVFSLLFIAAMIFPTFVLGMFNTSGIMDYIVLFVLYLGLAFIATFFNVATVYIAKSRFEGRDATFMQSLKFAFSKIHLIFMWSIVSAVVGLILRAIEQLAERIKGPGAIVLHILRGILGMAWSIMTIFVVPVLVYKDKGPFDAIKESTQTIKKTWGESLVRYFGLGLAQFVFLAIGFAVMIGLFILTSGLGPIAMMIVLGIGMIYLVGVFLVFSVANQIYNTALYVYAQTGKVPDGFNEEVLAHAFEQKQR